MYSSKFNPLHRLFKVLYFATLENIENGNPSVADWAFIETLPSRCEDFDLTVRQATAAQRKLREKLAVWEKSLEDEVKRKKPYRFNYHVISLKKVGFSIRETVELLNLEKWRVERTLKEYRSMQAKQLEFDLPF